MGPRRRLRGRRDPLRSVPDRRHAVSARRGLLLRPVEARPGAALRVGRNARLERVDVGGTALRGRPERGRVLAALATPPRAFADSSRFREHLPHPRRLLPFPAASRALAPSVRRGDTRAALFGRVPVASRLRDLSLIHISEPTRLGMISYAVFCLKKK